MGSMKTKQHIEVLHETKQTIQGNEPFLRFARPRIIINLSSPSGSHNFFEGYLESVARIKPGDTLAFQWVRVTQVPMKWYERVWEWVKR